jgi:hypothetical protein
MFAEHLRSYKKSKRRNINYVNHGFSRLCRQEFLDHVLFWNAKDLARKLDQYRNYH